jgi:predicted amidohydrolase YtcJ
LIFCPKEGKVIDLQGQIVFPGFHDAHIHMYLLGQKLMSLDCSGCASIEELQNRIKKFSSEHPDLPWITGAGWDQEMMGRYPTKADIDSVETTRPVVLQRACYHICVCNR